MLALLVLASLDRVDWQSFDYVVSRLEVYQVFAIPGHLLNEEKSTCIVEHYPFYPLKCLITDSFPLFRCEISFS
jgi:hypothetical protein